MNKLVQAMQLAADRHELQEDKNGSPFVGHPARVAMYLAQDFNPTEEQLIAAYLHDVVEDTDTTLMEVEGLFGFDVALLVDALTRREGERYTAYIDRIVAAGSGAIELKLCDLRDNMDTRRNVDESRSMMRRRYMPAKQRLEEAL